MAYRSNIQLAQVLNSQRWKISILLWASSVTLQKKIVLQTVKMAKYIYRFLQAFSFNYTIFFPPSFPWTLIHLELLMFTLWSVKRGSDHPDRLHITMQLFQAGATCSQQVVLAAKCKSLLPNSVAQPTLQTTSTPLKILFFDISPEEIPREGSGTSLKRGVFCPWQKVGEGFCPSKPAAALPHPLPRTWRYKSSLKLCTLSQVLCE